jgi:DNA-3-methyladenine glycosylase I
MAKTLKKRGFRFVGPTTAYALMQATGMVNDHVADCWVRTDDTGVAGAQMSHSERSSGMLGS